jgi:hypothetical protein
VELLRESVDHASLRLACVGAVFALTFAPANLLARVRRRPGPRVPDDVIRGQTPAPPRARGRGRATERPRSLGGGGMGDGGAVSRWTHF